MTLNYKLKYGSMIQINKFSFRIQMNQFHFWLPRIIYINQSKIKILSRDKSTGPAQVERQNRDFPSRKMLLLSSFLFPARRPRPPSIFLKKQDKIRKTKRGIKGRAKSWGKENGEKGNKGGRGMRRGYRKLFHTWWRRTMVKKKKRWEKQEEQQEDGGGKEEKKKIKKK